MKRLEYLLVHPYLPQGLPTIIKVDDLQTISISNEIKLVVFTVVAVPIWLRTSRLSCSITCKPSRSVMRSNWVLSRKFRLLSGLLLQCYHFTLALPPRVHSMDVSSCEL